MMCCFSRPILSVSATRIFARLTGHGSQFIVYRMQYASAEQNAMILPIPTRSDASEDSVKFVNLQPYPQFFDEMRLNFPNLQPPRMLALPSRDSTTGSVPLKVHQVGHFVASVVPAVEDFRRLDPRFSIAPEVWAKIPAYHDYSFVVFKLEELRGEPHPMAFEFATRHPESLFFPTVHIHDGEVHEREEFDHELFCQHENLDAKAGKYTAVIDAKTGWMRSKEIASSTMKIADTQQIVAGDQLIHRRFIRGLQANNDVLVTVSKNTTKDKTSLFSPTPAIPSLLGLTTAGVVGSLAWIIKRRNQRMPPC